MLTLGLEELLQELPEDHLAKRELKALRDAVRVMKLREWGMDQAQVVDGLRREAVKVYQEWCEGK